ncbi:hypothetical protein Bpfe_023523 [Biomphalaria pfeifferi]|uniref:Uncharacterized protein n=1 Tax=Biomphalaria pfeifferi TaxID=112525 RepID=A0AAD8F0P5_BIOPF|nr:hypothetical protein Bpfe_023523 [Biomphalaria pfeifferi]
MVANHQNYNCGSPRRKAERHQEEVAPSIRRLNAIRKKAEHHQEEAEHNQEEGRGPPRRRPSTIKKK